MVDDVLTMAYFPFNDDDTVESYAVNRGGAGRGRFRVVIDLDVGGILKGIDVKAPGVDGMWYKILILAEKFEGNEDSVSGCRHDGCIIVCSH